MLELQLKPQFNVVQPPRMLQEGYLVYFPTTWPSTWKFVSGQMFQVGVTRQMPYDISYILPGDDYRDVDFSNGGGTWQENIYPENEGTLEEVAIGFKPGNYITEFWIPANKTSDYLEYAGMYPPSNPVGNTSNLLYLGAYKPSDSPYDNPQLFTYFIQKLTPLIMRVYVKPDVDYEKVVVGLRINKIKMTPVTSPTEAQKTQAKVIHYYEEDRW